MKTYRILNQLTPLCLDNLENLDNLKNLENLLGNEDISDIESTSSSLLTFIKTSGPQYLLKAKLIHHQSISISIHLEGSLSNVGDLLTNSWRRCSLRFRSITYMDSGPKFLEAPPPSQMALLAL